MKINFDNDIILENDVARIEPLGLHHFERLSSIVEKNPTILKHSPPKFGTPELLKIYIEDNLALRLKESKYPFAILDKRKNQYAGCTSFLNISVINSRAEIGSTWIGRDFQRTGLNRNCKFLLLSYAFEKLGVERIEFKTDKRNLQSQKAITCIGAAYEGTLRSHTVMSDGYRRDTIYYSILRDEWPNIKDTIFANFQIESKF